MYNHRAELPFPRSVGSLSALKEGVETRETYGGLPTCHPTRPTRHPTRPTRHPTRHPNRPHPRVAESAVDGGDALRSAAKDVERRAHLERCCDEPHGELKGRLGRWKPQQRQAVPTAFAAVSQAGAATDALLCRGWPRSTLHLII